MNCNICGGYKSYSGGCNGEWECNNTKCGKEMKASKTLNCCKEGEPTSDGFCPEITYKDYDFCKVHLIEDLERKLELALTVEVTVRALPDGEPSKIRISRAEHDRLSKVSDDLLKYKNHIAMEALETISKSMYEATPWYVVPSSEAVLAKTALEKIAKCR